MLYSFEYRRGQQSRDGSRIVLNTSFIGAGTMGEAMIAALVRSGSSPAQLAACDLSVARREHLTTTYGIVTTANVAEAALGADLVVLAVKPQDFSSVGKTLGEVLLPGQTVISIMAGVGLAQMRHVLGHPALVRAMPNTPAQIGAGFVVWAATPEVTERARGYADELLTTLGSAVEAPEEKYVEMATAVSGSGPGFVYFVIEAMIDGAVQIGLSRDLATRMVCETVLGSAKFMQATGEHPAVLRNRVTSPGGTTAAGLAAMEEMGVRAGLAAAIVAAYERTCELGG